MLSTKVKASSITNLTDARYFAAMGVEWLGFNLNSDDESAISPEKITEIEEWVEGVQIVAEYGNDRWENVTSGLEKIIPNVVQVGGDIGVEEVLELPAAVGVIKELVIGRNSSLDTLVEIMESLEGHVSAFSLNFTENDIKWKDLEAGTPFSIEVVKELAGKFPIIFEMDFNADSLKKCIDSLPLEGITFKGGEEEKTGFKSYEELDELFDVLMD